MSPKNRIIIAAALALSFAFVAQSLLPRAALAHPLSQGFMEIEVFRDRVMLRVRVSLEEVVISGRARVSDDDDLYHLKKEDFTKHGEYLLKHFYLTADGKALSGKLNETQPPDKISGGISPLDIQSYHAIYEMEYALSATPPADLTVKQDVLAEVMYTPGNPWQATYILRVLQDGGEGDEGLLLASGKTLSFKYKWSAAPAVQPPPATPEIANTTKTSAKSEVKQDRWRMAGDYLRHGVEHILGSSIDGSILNRNDIGYDHLLFVCALVLGVSSLWDLLKVVTAFTLAHSLTLTLCVLDIFRLPERVVEPMIALSIVFVAVENVFWPNRTKGWGRLGAAFFFGLFHGLGFAGGLLDAMESLGGGAVLVAIVAFSVGVEIGHQVVVLPFFGALRLLRRSQKDDEAREKLSKLTLKYGSMVISVAGLFFLVAALHWIGTK